MAELAFEVVTVDEQLPGVTHLLRSDFGVRASSEPQPKSAQSNAERSRRSPKSPNSDTAGEIHPTA